MLILLLLMCASFYIHECDWEKKKKFNNYTYDKKEFAVAKRTRSTRMCVCCALDDDDDDVATYNLEIIFYISMGVYKIKESNLT
jgi:hypothetical protein